MFNPEQKFEGGYTVEQKQEALKQAEKERQILTLGQTMDSLVFSKYKKDWQIEGRLDEDNKRYIETLENEYKNNRPEIPLAQIQFEMDTVEKDNEELSREKDPSGYLKAEATEKIIQNKKRIEEFSLLEKMLLRKSGISGEKLDSTDLGEYLRVEQRAYSQELRKKPQDKFTQEKFTTYNKLSEAFNTGNFQPEIWRNILREVESGLQILKIKRDNMLYELANNKTTAEKIRDSIKETLTEQEKFLKFKELLEKDLYGSGGKTEGEKQKIEEIREQIKEKGTIPKTETREEATEKKKEEDIARPKFLTPNEFKKQFNPEKEYQDISDKDIKNFRSHMLGAVENLKLDLARAKNKQGPHIRCHGHVASILGEGQAGFAQKIAAKEGRIMKWEEIAKMDIRKFLKEFCGHELKQEDWDEYFN